MRKPHCHFYPPFPARLLVLLMVAVLFLTQSLSGSTNAMAQASMMEHTSNAGHDHARMDMASKAPKHDCLMNDTSVFGDSDAICGSVCDSICSVQAIDLLARYVLNHQVTAKTVLQLPASAVLTALTAVEKRPPRAN